MNNVATLNTDTKPQTDEERREALRQRIEASEQRNAERSFADQAKDVLDSATDFAKKHPLAVVGGAIGVGLLIGAMTRPGRRLGRRTGTMAAMAGDTVLGYAMGLMDRAETAGAAALRSSSDAIEDLGDSVGSTARRLRRDAAYRADATSDALASSRRRAGRKASRRFRSLKSRLSH
ncbi:hypothetical protein A3736_09555 [Erythrobacter sp. HI0063]|jgi:ElaB/YqjD/DUF883 family membrane-anchored ribosome-binding protein|uniref:hypothetical protein n=1 Tax=Erythrobacter sp. HI0063 TaxID=1822240 RepID=UPI0007C37772|nr:hypothetical protein [Erythrobacter sp. HI0063]KZY55840.1 hypothetical protein A3736_09555 [Erythrobacter sp. HI0063]